MPVLSRVTIGESDASNMSLWSRMASSLKVVIHSAMEVCNNTPDLQDYNAKEINKQIEGIIR